MIASDHSQKRAAPPNPSRIRGDVCGLNGDRKIITSSHDDPGPTVIRIKGVFFGNQASPSPDAGQGKELKHAENHDVSVTGRGGQVL